MIIFKVGTWLNFSLILQAFNLDMLPCKRRRFNRIFQKNGTKWNVAPLFANKIKSKERITLMENENILSNDKKVAKIFHEFFSNVAKCLNISWNSDLISGTSQTDPVLHSIEKCSKHPSIINIKKKEWIFQVINFPSNLKLKRNFLN